MILWSALFCLYVLIATFFAYMTRQEQQRQEQLILTYKVMSCIACILWPLALLAVAFVSYGRPASFPPADLD